MPYAGKGILPAWWQEVTLTNSQGPVAFFNRLSVVDKDTKERLLPAFYSDNYISVLPGGTRKVLIDYPTPAKGSANPMISIKGWNMAEQFIYIDSK